MNTTENNKLLAEFMGFEKETDPTQRFYGNWFTQPTTAWGIRLEVLHFDTDWNWLMQVVEKIESLGNDILITTNYIQIGFDEGEQFIVVEEVNVKIEAVYQAVLEFVKWYNEQKN